MEKTNKIFPKGEKTAAAVFTGTAYVTMLIADTDNVYSCQVYDVVFEAGGTEQLAHASRRANFAGYGGKGILSGAR
jgi:hypothetical protein